MKPLSNTFESRENGIWADLCGWLLWDNREAKNKEEQRDPLVSKTQESHVWSGKPGFEFPTRLEDKRTGFIPCCLLELISLAVKQHCPELALPPHSEQWSGPGNLGQHVLLGLPLSFSQPCNVLIKTNCLKECGSINLYTRVDAYGLVMVCGTCSCPKLASHLNKSSNKSPRLATNLWSSFTDT